MIGLSDAEVEHLESSLLRSTFVVVLGFFGSGPDQCVQLHVVQRWRSRLPGRWCLAAMTYVQDDIAGVAGSQGVGTDMGACEK